MIQAVALPGFGSLLLIAFSAAPAAAHQISEQLQPLKRQSPEKLVVEVGAGGVRSGPPPRHRAPAARAQPESGPEGQGSSTSAPATLADGDGVEAGAAAPLPEAEGLPTQSYTLEIPNSSSTSSSSSGSRRRSRGHGKSSKTALAKSSTSSSEHTEEELVEDNESVSSGKSTGHSSKAHRRSKKSRSSSSNSSNHSSLAHTSSSGTSNSSKSRSHSHKAHTSSSGTSNSSKSSSHSHKGHTSSSGTSSHSSSSSHSHKASKTAKTPAQEDLFAEDETATTSTTDPYSSVTVFHDYAVGAHAGRIGSLPIFLTGLAFALACMAIFLILFSILRRKFPLVYQHNFITKSVPFDLPGSFFGWLSASYKLRMDDVTACCGLDQALFLEFTHFGLWLFGTLAFPLLLIMGPIHAAVGGNGRDEDQLGRLGIGNVAKNHPYLYWVHAFLVWFVVVTVQRSVFWAQGRFMERRRNWLKAMPVPRATTVLVHDIPKDQCTDEKLRVYFNGIFDSDVVESVHIVKKTSKLCELLESKTIADLNVQEARFKEAQTNRRPTSIDLTGAVVDCIDHYSNISSQTARVIKEEQRRIKDAAENGDASVYTDKGFVTFKSRRDSEMALKVTFQPGESIFVEIPPDPADVIYSDLRKCPTSHRAMRIIGYLLLAGVFFAYLPIVLAVACFMNIHNVALHLSSVQAVAEDFVVATTWNALAGTLALLFVISLVPSFLNMIFSRFFVLQAQAWLQHKVQRWYFWFLVVYVLLITAVGSSVASTLDTIKVAPVKVFDVMAATMPFATHFYLTLLPLQWAAHTFGLLRWVPLLSFMGYRSVHEEQQAKELCEPESQDYHGLGSRSARQCFVVVLALVYCQLTPLINLLCFVEMLVCRLAYGYLVVFAETRKPDLGGTFWVTNLLNIQRCMRIYILLMAGVLGFRAQTGWPCFFAASSFLYLHSSFNKFSNTFCWESLPLEDIMDISPKKLRRSTRSTYEQPELCEQ